MSAFLETQPQAFKGKVLQWSLRRKHKIWTKGKLGQSKHKPRALWLDGMGVLHVVSSAANLVSCTSSMTALLPPRWACWARKHLNLAGWLNQAWTTAPSAQRLEFVKSSLFLLTGRYPVFHLFMWFSLISSHYQQGQQIIGKHVSLNQRGEAMMLQKASLRRLPSYWGQPALLGSGILLQWRCCNSFPEVFFVSASSSDLPCVLCVLHCARMAAPLLESDWHCLSVWWGAWHF